MVPAIRVQILCRQFRLAEIAKEGIRPARPLLSNLARGQDLSFRDDTDVNSGERSAIGAPSVLRWIPWMNNSVRRALSGTVNRHDLETDIGSPPYEDFGYRCAAAHEIAQVR